MRTCLLIVGLFILTACGIDGPPEQPAGGIETGGEARISVVGDL